jgi:hypothetical protein
MEKYPLRLISITDVAVVTPRAFLGCAAFYITNFKATDHLSFPAVLYLG